MIAPLGPRGRGPSLRGFLLLAALSSRLFLCFVVQSASLLIVYCAMFFLKAVHVDPFGIIFCHWFLSLWRVQVLTRRWTSYFCCLFSALPDLGGLGESASHPTSPFSLWKGECHNELHMKLMMKAQEKAASWFFTDVRKLRKIGICEREPAWVSQKPGFEFRN